MGNLKPIRIPGHSEKLAEFLGIILGDGNIRSDDQIAISFNLKTEQLYADYVSGLIVYFRTRSLGEVPEPG